MPYALCPMPYALCPMPYAHEYLIFLRKAISLIAYAVFVLFFAIDNCKIGLSLAQQSREMVSIAFRVPILGTTGHRAWGIGHTSPRLRTAIVVFSSEFWQYCF